jgi:hypothetical protein
MKLQFYTEKQTLLLELPNLNIPNPIERYAEKENFVQKSEFHITLVGNKTGLILIDAIENNNFNSNKLLDLARKYKWNYKLNTELFHLQKDYGEHVRDSLIHTIELPDLEKFYKDIFHSLDIVIKKSLQQTLRILKE